MKKLFTISLAFFYLMVASGVFVNYHYCGKQLKKISFFHLGNEQGCCGSKEKSAGCCKDKASFYKVKDNHHSSEDVKLSMNFFKGDLVNYSLLIFVITDSYASYKKINHHPPVIYDNPIFLKDKALLI